MSAVDYEGMRITEVATHLGVSVRVARQRVARLGFICGDSIVRRRRDLAKHSDEEWPPGRIVQHAAERGWGAIFDPRPSTGTRNGQRSHHHHRNGSRGLLGAVLDEEHAGRA